MNADIDVVELLEEKTTKPRKKEAEWEKFTTERGITIAKRRYASDKEKWQFEYVGFFRDNISWETLPEKLHSAVESALGDVVGEGDITRNNLSRIGRMLKSDVNGIPITSWVFDKLPPFDPDSSTFRITIEITNDEGER